MNTILPSSPLEDPKNPPKLKLKYPNTSYNIIIAQQSLPTLKYQYFFPIVDVSKRFEESLEKCRKKHEKQKMKIKAIEKMTISRQLSENIIENYRKNNRSDIRSRCSSESIETSEMIGVRNNRRASELVDELLLDIYGRGNFGIGSTERIFETEYGSSTSFKSITDKFDEKLQYSRLIIKDVTELRILIGSLRERVTYAGNLLVKQLKKRDALKSKQEKICNVITAHLHAYSDKRSEDTNMRFSPNPVPGDSGFNQWRDAMKMVAKLPGGIPPEFRRKLWIALAEKHLQSKGVNWAQTEKLCFNEWSNPDDSELGIQIVKDLHRTGCSLFCGAAGQENQALLKRVLLAYARWNKSVGYCQGFNMLAALILQVMDKNETDSVKVMIYLIEGVLPESYFANNLRGLSVDMIVFRDLLKMRLPQLSKHLEALQNDAREGNSYEPPLTNVFTMQWFLTLFCNCLPQSTVLRVWDLIFLEGNEILLRTAIAIWEKLSDRILAVNSADEFYSIMGVLTREMLEFGLVDSNTLIKSIVAIGTCSELNEMRDKYLYNITPWTQSVQTAAKKGFKLFYSDDDDVESDYDEKAAVTAAYGISIGRKRDKQHSNTKDGTTIQPYAHGHPDRERLALDISALKKQYAKLRERQRQAHIILQAACARQPMGQNSTTPPIAMNHLLLGKSAIVNSRGRRLGPPKGSIPPARTKKEPVKKKEPVPSGETIQWKDTAKFRRRQSCTEESEVSQDTFVPESDSSSYSEDDGSSTSTELCDEPGRMSDFDSDDKFSDILESKRTVKSIKNNLKVEKLSADTSELPTDDGTKNLGDLSCSEVVEIQNEFRELISEINELKIVETKLKTSDTTDFSELKNSEAPTNIISSKPNEPKTNEKVKNEDLLSLNDAIPPKPEEIKTRNIEETPVKEDEENFETFLQERVKILKENSSDSLTSPKDESTPWRRSSEERLRRHRSYEETSSNHLEKSVIFKQQSFDIGVLPTIETSLWKPYQIEEESPKEEIEDNIFDETQHSKRPKEIKKQASIDLLTVEDKRLEAGRRNSERALKIIQENSLILHRILQQQKSSEKEDSDDELSRSPISKTFLRSESLLSKDEKTDEERSSKDGDDELESGVESFSVSPALLDEESDRSKKDQFEDQDEILIISKNEDTEYSYKYQSSDNTSNIISSSIFDDSSITKNEEINVITNNLQMDTSPIVASFPTTPFDDYSPNVFEETAKFDLASNILDYSKDNEDNSSSSIRSDNKYTVDKYTKIEENTNRTIEDTEEMSPYRFSFKYKEESVDNINATQSKEDKHEELVSFLNHSSQNVSSSHKKEEDLSHEVKSPEKNDSKYSEEFLSYLKNSSSSKEETKEDILSFKIPEDDYSTKHDTYDSSSLIKEENKSFVLDCKEDIVNFKISEDTYSQSYENDDISSSLPKEDTRSFLQDSKEDLLSFKIPEDDYSMKRDLSNSKEETKSYLRDTKEDILNFKIPEAANCKSYENEAISSLPKEETKPYLLDSKEDTVSLNISKDDYSSKQEIYSKSLIKDNISSLPKEETKSYLPDSKEDTLSLKSPEDHYSPKRNTYKESYENKTVSSFPKEETKPYLLASKDDTLSFKIAEDDYSSKQDSYRKSLIKDNISSLLKEETKSNLPGSKEYTLSIKLPEDNYSPKHNTYRESYETETLSSLPKEETKPYPLESKEDRPSLKIPEDDYSYISKHDPYSKSLIKDGHSSLPKEETKPYLLDSKEDTASFKIPEDDYSYISKHDPYSKSLIKDGHSSLPKEETKTYLSNSKEDTLNFKKSQVEYSSKQDSYSKSLIKDNISSLPKEETKPYLPDSKEDTLSFKRSEEEFSSKQDSYSKSLIKDNISSLPKEETKSYLSDSKEDTLNFKLPEEMSSFSYPKRPEHSSPYKYRFREESEDNIKDKYTSSSSKYYRSSSPRYSSEDQDSTLYKEDTQSSSKFYYASKYELDSPEYSKQQIKSTIYKEEFSSIPLSSASSNIVKSVDKVVNDSADNNSNEEYQYNKNKLTIELAPSKYEYYSPEISPPKHLSCLQFTAFQTDIPCSSKSIQFSPICTKDNSEKSPQKISPTKSSPKYFSNFNLPTLSPPRRTLKSPLSPNKSFSPFPVQPTTRQPKELGVKLGLYKDLSPLKSPTK